MPPTKPGMKSPINIKIAPIYLKALFAFLNMKLIKYVKDIMLRPKVVIAASNIAHDPLMIKYLTFNGNNKIINPIVGTMKKIRSVR